VQPVLVIDVGGSHVKALASGEPEPRRIDSGPNLQPGTMMKPLLEIVADWTWEAVSIGVPTPVHGGRILSEPVNLGSGWVGFDFAAAFEKPTRIVNDAAMQALGSYESGKMLFLGLGTGLGSALVADGYVQPMELGHLPFRKRTFEDYVGERGLQKRGKKRWRKDVIDVVGALSAALEPDYVVLGGGNAKLLGELPDGVLLGDNANAFKGGFRVWDDSAPARIAA
jgi:predicted NBD/HSP70 family sugar kinase